MLLIGQPNASLDNWPSMQLMRRMLPGLCCRLHDVSSPCWTFAHHMPSKQCLEMVWVFPFKLRSACLLLTSPVATIFNIVFRDSPFYLYRLNLGEPTDHNPNMRPIRRSHRLSTRDQNRRSEAWANSDAFAGLEESNPYEDEGKKCELHTYERRFNTRGEPILLQSSCRSELGMEERSSTEAALILTRFYTLERDLETTQLAIQSPFIKAAFKAVVKSYPGINIESNGPIYINGEPRCLFYYRDELRDYASILQDKTAEEHINFCLEYMSRTLHREILAYENMMQGESLITGLDFHNLWMVFKPGKLLYCLVKHEVVISRLREMHKRKNDDGSEFWCIYAETLCCNGSVFGYRYQKSNIEYYDGYRPLTELVIYPLDHHKESEKIRIDMIARGKKFISLFGAHHCIYNGSAELLYSNRSYHSREASLVSSSTEEERALTNTS